VSGGPSADAAYDDLDAIRAECWRLLEAGAQGRGTAFHAPTLATLGRDGRPRLRTVVLRGVDAAARRLRVHCDRRSDKVAEIRADPRVALHVYDAQAKVQVRVEGRADVHAHDAAAEAAWQAARPMSRACYAVAPASGSPIPEGGAYAMPERAEADSPGRANFATLAIEAETIEFLHLARAGHRRARFTWTGEGWTAAWRVP
jgi:pyridoxamine 5'-phosphate oxidase